MDRPMMSLLQFVVFGIGGSVAVYASYTVVWLIRHTLEGEAR